MRGDDAAMIARTSLERDSSGDKSRGFVPPATTSFDTGDSHRDPLQGLERFLPFDASRLTLKWEPSQGDNHSKIIVGINTYLPLYVEKGCFSIEIPQQQQQQSCLHSPNGSCANSVRKVVFRLVSKIALLSPSIRELDLEGFGKSNHNIGQENLDIEDVFEAFAREESSSWRRGSLVVLRTWNCDMNSARGNQWFDLAEHEYPEGLEEVYVHNPKGSVLSSSIFRITSRSKKFSRFYVFDGYNKADNITGEDLHQFNGSRLTQSSIDALCQVLSVNNRLLDINQLPFRELLQLPESEFRKILEATTTTPNALKIQKTPGSGIATNLRFPVVPPRMVSKLTILATRAEALRFYLLWKRSLEILRNPSKRALLALVLQKCQKQRSIRKYIPYSKNDLIFAMVQDSLEGILEGRNGR